MAFVVGQALRFPETVFWSPTRLRYNSRVLIALPGGRFILSASESTRD
jgi:hypothetical protein